MQKLIWISFLGLFVACELFVSKEETTQKLVEEELLQIDWNDVSQYPLVEGCNENLDKNEQRLCFENAMADYFSETLADLNFQVERDIVDTVFVDFLIDEHGFITVQNIEEKASVLSEINNFNDEVSKRLNDLTTVAPAIKQGIPVSIRFRLPVVLNTQ